MKMKDTMEEFNKTKINKKIEKVIQLKINDIEM